MVGFAVSFFFFEIFKETFTAGIVIRIYHELQTSKLIRHRPLCDYRKVQFRKDEYGAILEHAKLSISYDVTLDHLVNIDADDLNSWETAYLAKQCEYPLDELYQQKGLLIG